MHVTVLLAIQAAAGAITVGFDNAPWSVALHLLLAVAFVTALLRVALMARLAELMKFIYRNQSQGQKILNIMN